jgi:hypothetical protein
MAIYAVGLVLVTSTAGAVGAWPQLPALSAVAATVTAWIDVLGRELMASHTVGLVFVLVSASIARHILFVRQAGVPPQIIQSVIGRVVIEMARLHAFRPRPHESFKNKGVYANLAQHVPVLQVDLTPPHSVDRRTEDALTVRANLPARQSNCSVFGSDAPLVGYRVDPFPPRNWSPLFDLRHYLNVPEKV